MMRPAAAIAMLLSVGLSAPAALVAVSPAAQGMAPAGTASEAAPTAGAPVADTRARFEIDVEGGKALLLAETVNYQPGEQLLAETRVELRFQDLVLTANVMRLDLKTETITAEGHVLLDEGPRRLTGDTLEYSLTERTGRLSNATAHMQPDYYFSGAELAKVGPDTFTVTDGVFTSCEGEVPAWSIALSSARVTLEKYAKIKNARMRFKNVPVFYLPYMLWPAKTDRASGLLIPKPGYSDRRGGYLGLAYFQTLGRSADLTIFGDLYSKSYFGTGAEVRWTPSTRSKGRFQAYFVTEPSDQTIGTPGTLGGEFRPIFDPFREPGDNRWKVSLYHETNNLWKNFRAVVDLVDYSDFDYQGDYEHDVRRSAQPYIYSNAYLSGNFGNHSLNIMVDRRERILRNSVDLRHQLPEVEYRLRPTRLGNTPLYIGLLSSINNFRLESVSTSAAPTPTFDYGRADVRPELSIPLSTIPWLSAKLKLGGRLTYYSDSLTPDRRSFSGDSLTRTIGFGGLEVVGPSISRIYDKKIGHFVKFKHVIEPRLDFKYVDDFDPDVVLPGTVRDRDLVPFFDEVDSVTTRTDVVFSITNRLIAKPAPKIDKDGKPLPEQGAFEIASFSLAQGFSFDDDKPLQRSRDGMLTRSSGPLFASLRFNPSRRTSIRADAAYNTLFRRIQSTSLTGSLALGTYNEVGATWFTTTRPEDGFEQRNQAQVFLKLGLIPNRLFLDTAHRFDLRSDDPASNVTIQRTLEQFFSLRWESCCFSMRFEYSENNFLNAAGEEFRFSLTLKNVGTFLDINGF